MNKTLKCSIGAVILALIGFAASYIIHLATLAGSSTPAAFIVLLLTGAVVIIGIAGLFVLINKKTKWFNDLESKVVIFIETSLYALLMIFIFPLIPVPYSIIPSGEMAYGFSQLLTQCFHCGGAGICWLISGVGILYRLVTRKS